jgi:hypothetical protein
MNTLFSNLPNLYTSLKVSDQGLERNWQNYSLLVNIFFEIVFEVNNSKYFQDYSSPDFIMTLISLCYLLVLFQILKFWNTVNDLLLIVLPLVKLQNYWKHTYEVPYNTYELNTSNEGDETKEDDYCA